MDIKTRLGCQLSQFPATVGGVRTAQPFSPTPSSHHLLPPPSSCQAAWPAAAAGQSERPRWRDEARQEKLPAPPIRHTLTLQSGAEWSRAEQSASCWLGSALDGPASLALASLLTARCFAGNSTVAVTEICSCGRHKRTYQQWKKGGFVHLNFI